jgi:hypothetical protein
MKKIVDPFILYQIGLDLSQKTTSRYCPFNNGFDVHGSSSQEDV